MIQNIDRRKLGHVLYYEEVVEQQMEHFLQPFQIDWYHSLL